MSNSNSSSSSSNESSSSNNETPQLSITPIPLQLGSAVEEVATKYLKKGTIIESPNSLRRFEVIECIKRGTLCVIVKLQERNVPLFRRNKVYILKAECGPSMDEEIGLKSELNILSKVAEARQLRPAMVDNFVELFDRGLTDHFRFIIVTALGLNLADLQKTYNGFPMPTAVRINKRMFNAIKNLQVLGFIHRNIQPSNFAIGSQTQSAVIFLIGFSLSTRYEMNASNGFECEIPKVQQPPRRMNTLNSIYMSRRNHSTMNLTRMDDIESWLYCCLEICVIDSIPWKRSYQIPSESLEMKWNFFYHQYTFELFHERIPMDYQRIIDIINSSQYGSTPDYSKISEINDKICKHFPTLHKRKQQQHTTTTSTAATSPAAMDTTRSLILPTIRLPTSPAPLSIRDSNSLYGIPPSQDIFPFKDKPKDAKSKHANKNLPNPTKVNLPNPAKAIISNGTTTKSKDANNNNTKLIATAAPKSPASVLPKKDSKNNNNPVK